MIPKWKKWMMFGILGMLSLFIISFLLSSSLSSFLLLKLSFFAFLLTGIMMVVFLVASLVTTKNLKWGVGIIVLLMFIGGVAWVYWNNPGIIYPGDPGIDVQLNSKKVNNTYIITVTNVHLDDKIYLPNGDEFHGDPMLIKYYRYAIPYSTPSGPTGSGAIFGNVTDILEKENNITFYDKDKDGRISVGDEFVIAKDALPQTCYGMFELEWKPFGSRVGVVKFK